MKVTLSANNYLEAFSSGFLYGFPELDFRRDCSQSAHQEARGS